ncbi:MAG: hypothetical protein GY796_29865 [Chloroflexi bacterium]|nr:hypothetical protein [Chloroflexota bacterium]
MDNDFIMKKHFLKFGCGCGTIIIILIIAGLWWILYTTSDPFYLNNKNHAFEVTQLFSLSLMANRSETLKSLVDPDQWHRIDTWVVRHEAVTSCSIPRWDLENPPWFAVGSTSPDGKRREETLTLSLPCPDHEKYYCLKIENIAMKKRDEGWQIYDWGEIHETWHTYPCN